MWYFNGTNLRSSFTPAEQFNQHVRWSLFRFSWFISNKSIVHVKGEVGFSVWKGFTKQVSVKGKSSRASVVIYSVKTSCTHLKVYEKIGVFPDNHEMFIGCFQLSKKLQILTQTLSQLPITSFNSLLSFAIVWSQKRNVSTHVSTSTTPPSAFSLSVRTKSVSKCPFSAFLTHFTSCCLFISLENGVIFFIYFI